MSDNITREPYRNAWYKQLADAVKKHNEEIAEMRPHLVPEVEEDDNGKILIAGEDGAFNWGQPPEELPPSTQADNGKLLGVNSDGLPEWLTTPTGYIIDDTLTLSNAAADAKTVGDSLSLKMNKGYRCESITFSTALNKYIDNTGTEVSNINYAYAMADITGVTGKLRIRAYASSYLSSYIFFDSSDNIISYGETVGTEKLYVLTIDIPANATKIVVNGKMYSAATFPVIDHLIYDDKLNLNNSGILSNMMVPTEYDDIILNWITGVGYKYTDNSYVNTSAISQSTVFNVSPGEYYRIRGNNYYDYNIIGLHEYVNGVSAITWIPNASNAAYIDTVIKIPDNVISVIIQRKTDQVISVKKAVGFADGRIFKGKKVAIIGDSTIERNSTAVNKWYDNIGALTGLEVVNLGISGSGYKNPAGNNKAYYERLNSIPADVDAVIIFGSGNDNQYTAGLVTDNTTDTVLGCVNKTITDLITLYPLKKIGVITAYPWASWKPSTDNNMQTIADGIVQICKNESIPCLDLYHESNLRPWITDNNNEYFANSDGVHANDKGHEILTPIMLSFLKKILLPY